MSVTQVLVSSSDGKVLKAKIKSGATIRRLKTDVHKRALTEVDASELVIVSPNYGLLDDTITIEDAGLENGTVTLMTRREFTQSQTEAGGVKIPPSARQPSSTPAKIPITSMSPSLAPSKKMPSRAPSPLHSLVRSVKGPVGISQTTIPNMRPASPLSQQTGNVLESEQMNLKVLSHVGDCNTFVMKDLNKKHTFSRLTKLLARSVDRPASSLAIVAGGKRMDGRMSIEAAGVTPDATLELVDVYDAMEPPSKLQSAPAGGFSEHLPAWGNGDTITIVVENAKGESLPIRATELDTIADLSDQIEDAWGIPKSDQRLVLRNEALNPSDSVRKAGLEEGSHISLLVRSSRPLNNCSDCGQPFITPFCRATGARHIKNPNSTIDSINDNPSIKRSVMFETKRIDEDASLAVPLSTSSDVITFSVYCKVDNKEYRLPACKPHALTVRRIKTKLAECTGIPISEQVLKTVDDMVLKENHTLFQAGITNGETLIMCAKTMIDVLPPGGKQLQPTTLSNDKDYPAMSPPSQYPITSVPSNPRMVDEFQNIDTTRSIDRPPAVDMIPRSVPPPQSGGLEYPVPPPFDRRLVSNSVLPIRQDAVEEELLYQRLRKPPPSLDEMTLYERERELQRRMSGRYPVSRDVQKLIQQSSSHRRVRFSPTPDDDEDFKLIDVPSSHYDYRSRAADIESQQQQRVLRQRQLAHEDQMHAQEEAFNTRLQGIQQVADNVNSTLTDIKQKQSQLDSQSKSIEETTRAAMEKVFEERLTLEKTKEESREKIIADRIKEVEKRERERTEELEAKLREKEEELESEKKRRRDDIKRASQPRETSAPAPSLRRENRAERLKTIRYPPQGGAPEVIYDRERDKENSPRHTNISTPGTKTPLLPAPFDLVSDPSKRQVYIPDNLVRNKEYTNTHFSHGNKSSVGQLRTLSVPLQDPIFQVPEVEESTAVPAATSHQVPVVPTYLSGMYPGMNVSGVKPPPHTITTTIVYNSETDPAITSLPVPSTSVQYHNNGSYNRSNSQSSSTAKSIIDNSSALPHNEVLRTNSCSAQLIPTPRVFDRRMSPPNPENRPTEFFPSEIIQPPRFDYSDDGVGVCCYCCCCCLFLPC